MTDNPVLTIMFIVAVAQFFKVQLNLKGWRALLAVFVVALFMGLVPVVIEQFPAISLWLSAVVNVIVLFLGAAGSVDFVMEVRASKAKPESAIIDT